MVSGEFPTDVIWRWRKSGPADNCLRRENYVMTRSVYSEAASRVP